jgi:hypothetical protein
MRRLIEYDASPTDREDTKSVSNKKHYAMRLAY